MSLVSVFDGGSCTVRVDKAGTTYWSGVLGKGQTSPVFDGAGGAGETLQVGVDASGVVTLTSIAGVSNEYLVAVVPSFDWQSKQPQIADITIYAPSASPFGQQVWGTTDGSQSVALSTMGPAPGMATYTPNPVDMSSLAGMNCMGVQIGAST
jgi:hypothetical protein